MQIRLFNRPLTFTVGSPTARMWIDGLYEDYVAGEAYEGRVKINGSVGLCKLEVIDSNIPPNASVWIDQITKEVVVRWDTYTPPVETVSLVPNGDFALGAADWEGMGVNENSEFPVFHDSGYGPDSNKNNAAFHNRKGDYSILGSWAPAPNVNKLITLSAVLEQGKSSKGNAGAALSLSWYDEDRKLLRTDTGDYNMSGGKQKWAPIEVKSSSSDTKAAFVRPGVAFRRKKQNYRVHVSNVKWDYAYTKGYDADETMFVEVRVTDSTNNVATHRGTIDEFAIWLTSKPYPVLAVESTQFFAPDVVGIERKPTVGSQLESVSFQRPSVVGITRKSTLQVVNIGPDSVLFKRPNIFDITRKKVLVQVDAGIESVKLNRPSITSLSHKKHPYTGPYIEQIQMARPVLMSITRSKP